MDANGYDWLTTVVPKKLCGKAWIDYHKVSHKFKERIGTDDVPMLNKTDILNFDTNYKDTLCRVIYLSW